MRGFVFSIDMLYGAAIIVFFFAILSSVPTSVSIPQHQMLQLQAKDAALAWFYSSPDPDPLLMDACPLSGDQFCACDTAFRPRVTTNPLSYSTLSDWSVQTVCVVSP